MTLAEVADIFGLASYAGARSVIRKVRRELEEKSNLEYIYKYIIPDPIGSRK